MKLHIVNIGINMVRYAVALSLCYNNPEGYDVQSLVIIVKILAVNE